MGVTRAERLHHPGLGGLGGDGQAHAAAARAEVQHPALPQLLYVGDGLFGQHLGVRPGDEDVLGDVQGEAVELPLADEVGHRLPGHAPLHQPPDLRLPLRGGIQAAVPGQLLPVLAGAEAHQLPGLQGGGLHAALPELAADLQIQVVIGNGHAVTPLPPLQRRDHF